MVAVLDSGTSTFWRFVIGSAGSTERFRGDAGSLDALEASATFGAEKKGGVPTGEVAL